MKTEGLDFRGALEKLAGKAGVELKPRDNQAEAQDRQKERLKEACAAACRLLSQPISQPPCRGQSPCLRREARPNL